jgi:hypothetical protein
MQYEFYKELHRSKGTETASTMSQFLRKVLRKEIKRLGVVATRQDPTQFCLSMLTKWIPKGQPGPGVVGIVISGWSPPQLSYCL